MIEEVLKKHIKNMIKDGKFDILEGLKKDFIGVVTHIDDDLEYSINNFDKHGDFDKHIEEYNHFIEKIKKKKEIAIKIYNCDFRELHLIANYLDLNDIYLAVERDNYEDNELWELNASVSELLGYKIIRNKKGECMEIHSSW